MGKYILSPSKLNGIAFLFRPVFDWHLASKHGYCKNKTSTVVRILTFTT